MKKIIVPVDFSKHSEYALKTAALLAKKNDSELIVLHMLEMSDIMLTASDGVQNEKMIFFYKLAEQRFEDFLDKDYLTDVKVTPIVKHFKVFSEVNDVAKINNADVIVMGSHGASGVREFIMGSNTERVVRYADIPVIVVKSDVSEINIKNIVFASDFSEDVSGPYLKALDLFKNLGAKMHFVYVNLPNEKFRSSSEIETKVTKFFKNVDGNLDNIKNVSYVSDYTVDRGVISFAEKVAADLIIAPTHGKKGLANFLEGSVGEDIVNHSELPVMTFKI